MTAAPRALVGHRPGPPPGAGPHRHLERRARWHDPVRSTVIVMATVPVRPADGVTVRSRDAGPTAARRFPAGAGREKKQPAPRRTELVQHRELRLVPTPGHDVVKPEGPPEHDGGRDDGLVGRARLLEAGHEGLMIF